jgi:hypothetical protein
MSENKSLMALQADYQRLMMLLMAADGELTPEIEAELSVNQEMIAAKADRYEFIISKLESEETHWKAQAERYSRVARTCANTRERLRSAIKATMQGMGITEIVGESICFKLTNAAPRVVITEPLLPKEYVTETIIREPNKEKIKGALKEGVAISGAILEPVVALRTSIARKVK